MILINSKIPVSIEETPGGGRITTTIVDGVCYRKYTHPSRAKSFNRLTRDVNSIVAAVNGNRDSQIKVRNV